VTADGFRGLDPCVHCGFCLQGCPTYRVTSDEADSPRGRIVLMRGLERGNLSANEPTLAYHLDRCLGCLACETSCPSGVNYGSALESVRALLTRVRPIPRVAHAVNTVMAKRRLRRPLLWAARLSRPAAPAFAGKSRLGFMMGMLGATRGLAQQRNHRTVTPTAHVSSVGSTTLLTGCIMEGLFSHVNTATARTLAVNGYRLVEVTGQACCGALHAHTGQHDRALQLARQNVRAFASVPEATIAVNSAGCGATLKNYGHILAGDPLEQEAISFANRVRDVSEMLADCGPVQGKPVPLRIAYDPPCHLLHAQGIHDPPIQVIDSIPSAERIPHADAAMCCGSAGSYSLTESGLSRAVLANKVAALLAVRPDVVATGNPGCIMQLGAGLRSEGSRVPVVHPVEILDRSYALAGFYAR
jgi:glycolate oxidase iron-sulfur subunit